MSSKPFFTQLSNRIFPGLARRRRREEEAAAEHEKYVEQRRKLEAGEEIEPPWVTFPCSDPLALWVGWRYGNHWLDTIWKPFWHSMDEDQRKAYLRKHQPPSEDWYQTVVVYWGESPDQK